MPVRSIPGPLHSLQALRRRPLHFFEQLSQQGSIVPFSLLWQRCVLLTDPQDIRQVLTSSYQQTSRLTPDSQAFASIQGATLLTTDGPTWHALRRALSPSFHRKAVAVSDRVIQEETQKLLERWQQAEQARQPLDIMEEMLEVTLAITCRALFSTDIHAQLPHINQHIRALEKCLTEALYSPPLPRFLPIPRHRRLQRALSHLKETLRDIIREHRQKDHTDLLSLLLSLQQQGSLPFMLDDTRLENEMLSFLLAGHETTASALTWACYLLSQAPAVQSKLEHELANVIGERLPLAEDLARLPYLGMVVKEAERLFPPVWLISRKAIQPIALKQSTIPAHALIFLCPWVTHRDPRWWGEHAHEFQPERFAEQSEEPEAYFPFGKGQHACIGGELALLEAQLVLAMIVQRYRLSLQEGYTVKPGIFPALRPRGGLPMLPVSLTAKQISTVDNTLK